MINSEPPSDGYFRWGYVEPWFAVTITAIASSGDRPGMSSTEQCFMGLHAGSPKASMHTLHGFMLIPTSMAGTANIYFTTQMSQTKGQLSQNGQRDEGFEPYRPRRFLPSLPHSQPHQRASSTSEGEPPTRHLSNPPTNKTTLHSFKQTRSITVDI